MPDTGFYTYGHDAKARNWHRQTSVHQTLTLDGKDARIDGRQLLRKSVPGLDVVAVENPSYPGLIHRRTVWFVQRKFFLILDEAIGEARGKLDLHFQLAPGEAQIDAAEHRATTLFPDANVLVWMKPTAPVTMEEEGGWFAWEYGHRTPRKAFRYRHDGSAPAAMLTVIYPYRGTQPPDISASISEDFRVGADRSEVEVEFSGQRWQYGRDLERNEAWGQSL
jgi:heparan-sulfate lyase